MKRFDPNNSFDIAAEKVRQAVLAALIAEREGGNLSRLRPHDQFGALMAGSLTAIVGALFCVVGPNSRDDVMQAISDYLAQARANAEEMLESRP